MTIWQHMILFVQISFLVTALVKFMVGKEEYPNTTQDPLGTWIFATVVFYIIVEILIFITFLF